MSKFYEELKYEFGNDKYFSEIGEEDHKLFLGGVIHGEEKFRKDSLAKFYQEFFGIKMPIDSWILQESLPEKVTELVISIDQTKFIEFINEIYSILNKTLGCQSLVDFPKDPVFSYSELKKNPNKLKNIVESFYKNVLNISLNYCYKTFFLCSINQLTSRYIKKAYPRFEQILDFLVQQFGLVEFSWNNPITDIESEIFKDYTIFCFPEYNVNNQGESFGGSLCYLNEKTWEYFSKVPKLREILSMLFQEIPDLREEYINRIKGQLPELFYSDIFYSGIKATNISDKNISILEVLDNNSPYLFANLKKFKGANDDNIWFEDA